MMAVAISIALITAFGELTLLAILKFGLHRELHLGPHVVWMTPVALLAVFAIPALILIVGSRLWSAIARPAVFVAALVFLMMINLILVERHFSMWALLVLSLGVAVQAGRIAEGHFAGFRRLLRLAAAGLAGLVLLLTVVVEGGIAVRESRSESRLPPAAAGARNVLFIILDTVRARTLGLYGYDRETTPNLDRIAATGVTFDYGIAPGTWTVPSHASMFTGLWPHQLRTWWSSPERLPPSETLAAFMSRNGYRTGGFIGNWFHIGAESGMGNGFVHYSDLGRSVAQIARGSAAIRWLSQRRSVRRWIGLYETLGRRRAPDVSASFLAWLDSDSERPWFAFLNYFDAHSPYLPPSPYDRRFGSSVSEREPVVIEELNRDVVVPPDVADAELDAYDGGMAYLDEQIGRLFDRLEARGALDGTIVIIGSDHGEELGEHGRWGHAYSLFAEVVHVPLIIIAPGAPRGLRVGRPASLRNIPATIADLAQLADPPFPGTSLAHYWNRVEVSVEEDPAMSEFGAFRSLYDDRYHYLVGVLDERERLYDYHVDPLDESDLSGAPGFEERLAVFRERLAAIGRSPTGDADPGVPPAGN